MKCWSQEDYIIGDIIGEACAPHVFIGEEVATGDCKRQRVNVSLIWCIKNVLQPDHNIDHDNVGDILILDINYDSKAQTVGQGTRSKMVTSGWTASGDWPSKGGQWLDFYYAGGEPFSPWTKVSAKILCLGQGAIQWLNQFNSVI